MAHSLEELLIIKAAVDAQAAQAQAAAEAQAAAVQAAAAAAQAAVEAQAAQARAAAEPQAAAGLQGAAGFQGAVGKAFSDEAAKLEIVWDFFYKSALKATGTVSSLEMPRYSHYLDFQWLYAQQKDAVENNPGNNTEISVDNSHELDASNSTDHGAEIGLTSV